MAAVAPPFAHQKRLNSWHAYGQFDPDSLRMHNERPISRDSAKAKQMLGLVTRLPNSENRAIWTADARPESRDSMKAKMMLGLVQEPAANRGGGAKIRREKSKTTRWLERPMYEALDSSELESDIAEEDSHSAAGVSQRTILPHELQLSPLSYHHDSQESEPVPKPWLRLERPASLQSSPATSPISTSSSDPFNTKPWIRPERPRPTSYVSSIASYRTDGRRSSKIASSRGFRVNSAPNFSRPLSGVEHRSVPGENIENDPIYNQYEDDEVGPPTPASPIGPTIEQALTKRDKEVKNPKRRSGRWSSIPQTFMRFARRRSSNAVEEPKPELKPEIKIERKKEVMYERQKLNLTEDNLHRLDGEVARMPKMYPPGLDYLPMPERSPLTMENSLFESPISPHSPQLSLHLRSGSFSGSPSASLASPHRRDSGAWTPSSIHRKPVPHLSINIPPGSASPSLPPYMEPQLSPFREPSLVPSPLSRVCVLCKEARPVKMFPARRVTATCAHQTGECLPCLQQWIEGCIETRGCERCSCPECGEPMAYEDVGAFASDDAFTR